MSFLQTLVHHPRKLWLRRALFQIHLWAGVLLSLYVVVIALTGSILIFRTELTKAALPRELSAYDASHTAPIEIVVHHFTATYPGAILQNLQLPSQAMPAFFLYATDAQKHPFRLVADPTNATLHSQPGTWLDWIYDLHVYLLLGHAYGMQVNGVGAAGLLLLTLSGIFLWWSGVKTWMRGLRIDFARNWRRINFDTHNAIGFWTLLLVSWWAFSGVYFGWYRQVTAAIAAVSPLRGMMAPKPPSLQPPGPHHATLPQIVAAIRQASPQGHLFSLSDPTLSTPTIYALVDLRAPGDFSHRDIIALSTTDSRVLTIWHYGQNHTVGDWVLWAMHPLHFGTLWGLVFKIIWATTGIALALLVITGFLMYWNRYLSRQLRC
jgi:uncharacterized iron-regulated membrane protein